MNITEKFRNKVKAFENEFTIHKGVSENLGRIFPGEL